MLTKSLICVSTTYRPSPSQYPSKKSSYSVFISISPNCGHLCPERSAIENTKPINMKTAIKVTLSTNELTPATKKEMWEVYQHYYHYPKEGFMARINRNTHYSFYKKNGKTIGFTGLRINKILLEGRPHLLVYFGQTVIDEKYRGSALLPRTALLINQKYWLSFFTHKVYFWAEALTYKAYLVFAKYLKEYYPNYQGPNPEKINQVIDFIGQEHYRDSFDPKTGTVQKDTIWVSDQTCRLLPVGKEDPDVAFYAIANPKNMDGHGLITLGPMHLSNIFNISKRILSKRKRSARSTSKAIQKANA